MNNTLIGKIIEERYLIEAELGAGGMGHVYRAHDHYLDRHVAVKMIHPWLATRESTIKRFQNEARVLTNLDHPCLLRNYGMGIDDGTLFMVMDLALGTSFDQWLRQRGRLDLKAFKAIFLDVMAGLSHAHSRGVLHRDIKPSNILVIEDKEGQLHAQLLDFGLAKLLQPPDQTALELTQTGELIGSPLYMSPEQSNATRVDERSDIYSLCCVMFEALSGAAPFAGNTALEILYKHAHEEAPDLVTSREIPEAIPIGLAQVIKQGMEKHPDDRYASVAELQADLEQSLCASSSAPIFGSMGALKPHNQQHRKKLKEKRRPIVLALCALVSCLAMAAIVILKYMGAGNQAGADGHGDEDQLLSQDTSHSQDTSSMKFDAAPSVLRERLFTAKNTSAKQWEQLGLYAEQRRDQKSAYADFADAAVKYADIERDEAGTRRCLDRSWKMLGVAKLWNTTDSAKTVAMLVRVAIQEEDLDGAENMLNTWHTESSRLPDHLNLSWCKSIQATLLSKRGETQAALAKANAAFEEIQSVHATPPDRLAVLLELCKVAHQLKNAQLGAKVAVPLAKVLSECETQQGKKVMHARLALGAVYGDLQKYNQARKTLDEVVNGGAPGDRLIALRQLGHIEMQVGRPSVAERHFKECLKLTTTPASLAAAYQQVGSSLLAQSKDSEAEHFFQLAITQITKASPTNKLYYRRLEVYAGLRTIAEHRHDQAGAARWQELITQVKQELSKTTAPERSK